MCSGCHAELVEAWCGLSEPLIRVIIFDDADFLNSAMGVMLSLSKHGAVGDDAHIV